MCMVSATIDYGQRTLPQLPGHIIWPDKWLNPNPVTPTQNPLDIYKTWLETIEAAKKFDKVNNEPDCESEEKVAFVADLVTRLTELGVSLIQEGKTEEGVEWVTTAKKLKELVLD